MKWMKLVFIPLLGFLMVFLATSGMLSMRANAQSGGNSKCCRDSDECGGCKEVIYWEDTGGRLYGQIPTVPWQKCDKTTDSLRSCKNIVTPQKCYSGKENKVFYYDSECTQPIGNKSPYPEQFREKCDATTQSGCPWFTE